MSITKRKKVVNVEIIEASKLKKQHPNMYKELIDMHGEGKWTKGDIHIHDNLEDFAYYELIDGHYSSMRLGETKFGAPSLINHINLTTIGEELKNTWNKGSYAMLKDGTIVKAPTGW